jgi:hypothetical protein
MATERVAGVGQKEFPRRHSLGLAPGRTPGGIRQQHAHFPAPSKQPIAKLAKIRSIGNSRQFFYRSGWISSQEILFLLIDLAVPCS